MDLYSYVRRGSHHEMLLERAPIAAAAAIPAMARKISAPMLVPTARLPAKAAAYPALSRLLEEVAIRMAAAIVPKATPEVPLREVENEWVNIGDPDDRSERIDSGNAELVLNPSGKQ